MRTFAHGVHPRTNKAYSGSKPIEKLPLPDEVFIPLQQHIGRECIPVVSKKEEVKTGQLIGKTSGFIASPIHSSVTGQISEIGLFMNSRGVRTQMVVVKRTGEDDWQPLNPLRHWEHVSAEELIQRVYEAGIVGLGGAAFPSHVKLKPLPEKPIASLILNGCECEPYLTCDHRLMLERTESILQGMQIALKLLKVKRAYFGIESDKSDVIAILQKAIKAGGYPVEVVSLKVKYPQGGEKLLIKAILNRKVPAGGLPGDVGVIVHNVGTMVAVKEAVIDGKPLISRIVSVTGPGIVDPKNLEVRIGTPLRHLIDFCGGLKTDTNRIIMGGPMMGFSQFDLAVPVVKSTSGVVCDHAQIEKAETVYPCIRCNSCVAACPMYLLPNRLSRFVEKGLYQEAEPLGLLNCIECGSCSYVCPSRIPILQWIQVGKYKVFERKRKTAV